MGMDLERVRAFLVLSEELHFGRTAQRLFRSQSRVSRLVSDFEDQIGAALFVRTSRSVRLTPLGADLEPRLRAAYNALADSIAFASRSAREVVGAIRIGATSTTDSPAVIRMARSFAEQHPTCEVTLVEVDVLDPLTALRNDEIDVLCSWLAVDGSDLQVGPVLERHERAVAVGSGHRWTKRAQVAVEELAEESVHNPPSQVPRAIADLLVPVRTPQGALIPRHPREFRSWGEVLALVAAGELVAPTVTSAPRYSVRRDVVLLPLTGLPAVPLGLIWSKAREDARIQALAGLIAQERNVVG
jgi:DNA-binding transcriptional LysR family regulator